ENAYTNFFSVSGFKRFIHGHQYLRAIIDFKFIAWMEHLLHQYYHGRHADHLYRYRWVKSSSTYTKASVADHYYWDGDRRLPDRSFDAKKYWLFRRFTSWRKKWKDEYYYFR